MDLRVFFHALGSSLHSFQDICQLLVSLVVVAVCLYIFLINDMHGLLKKIKWLLVPRKKRLLLEALI